MKKVIIFFCIFIFCINVCSCNSSFNASLGLSSYIYDSAERYTMGGSELSENIQALNISWINGKVNICYHSEDTVKFQETSNKDFDENNTLYFYNDNGTLYIKFAMSGKWDFSVLNKELTVFLPENLKLDNIRLDSVSSEIDIEEIFCEYMKIDTVSGDVNIDECTVKRLKCDTVSGDVKAAFKDNIDSVEIDTVSGDSKLFAHRIERLEIDTTSGDLEAEISELLENFNAETVSGDITFYLPEESDFTFEVDGLDKNFKSEFDTKKLFDKYIYGKGTCEYEVDTVSGDINLKIYKR